jgi:hypothetical protein
VQDAIVGHIYIIVCVTYKKTKCACSITGSSRTFAWDLLGWYFYEQDMGSVLQGHNFIWFFLDCFIVYFYFKYGWKQDVVLLKKEPHFCHGIVSIV